MSAAPRTGGSSSPEAERGGTDGRARAIARWLETLERVPREVEALTGDISLRRYFRAHFADGTSAIVAYYPMKLRAVCRRFRATTELFVTAGVPVPRVLAADCKRGLMLVEDVGTHTLYDDSERAWDVLAPLYRTAAEYVRRIQTLPRASVATLNPRLDASLLRWELRKSWDLVLVPHGLVGDEQTAAALTGALDDLCAELGREERLVPCHRDFMPRNLMVMRSDLLVLDHQDTRLGPPAYDLASLLNDSLFPPRALEEELRERLHPGAGGALDYRRAVVQRAIKAVGNYADFARRGFDRHLPLVKPTLARAWRWFDELPELRAVTPALRPAWQAFLSPLLD
jgi:aminoglycoside/choline kinase family phosphotransferase